MSEDRRRGTWSFTKLIIWTSALIKDLVTSPTISSGSGVPSAAEPNGSFYLRTNGATYNRAGGAWGATVNNSTALASTAHGEGASLVGVEDAGGLYTAADVEAALAEVKALTDSASQAMVEVADPESGAPIPVTASADIQMVTGAGPETGSLADPTKVGLTLHLRLTTDGGGNRVITAASAVNVAGNTSLTFADAGDSLILLSTRDAAAAYCWRIVANDGVALA